MTNLDHDTLKTALVDAFNACILNRDRTPIDPATLKSQWLLTRPDIMLMAEPDEDYSWLDENTGPLLSCHDDFYDCAFDLDGFAQRVAAIFAQAAPEPPGPRPLTPKQVSDLLMSIIPYHSDLNRQAAERIRLLFHGHAGWREIYREWCARAARAERMGLDNPSDAYADATVAKIMEAAASPSETMTGAEFEAWLDREAEIVAPQPLLQDIDPDAATRLGPIVKGPVTGSEIVAPQPCWVSLDGTVAPDTSKRDRIAKLIRRALDEGYGDTGAAEVAMMTMAEDEPSPEIVAPAKPSGDA